MRLLVLALLLAATAIALAPSATACHPSGPVGAGDDPRVWVEVEMGCSHLPPYRVCAGVEWSAVGFAPVCSPVPP